jgi:hypothetical protein
LNKARIDAIADGEIVVAMCHHPKAFDGIDQHNVVGDVRAGLRRRGAADQ